MIEMSVTEARNQFGHLLNLVEQGDKITITRRGKIVADIVPVTTTAKIKAPELC